VEIELETEPHDVSAEEVERRTGLRPKRVKEDEKQSTDRCEIRKRQRGVHVLARLLKVGRRCFDRVTSDELGTDGIGHPDEEAAHFAVPLTVSRGGAHEVPLSVPFPQPDPVNVGVTRLGVAVEGVQEFVGDV
jgi:hypothetical protein